jgi:diamine N-acetyltransferase
MSTGEEIVLREITRDTDGPILRVQVTPVGFVMLSVTPEKDEHFIWRFLVGAGFQGRGYGRRAMALVLDHFRALPGVSRVLLSHVPGEGNPGPFYEKLGFAYTGEEDDGELVMAIDL